jgi:hypothetical protein
MSRQTFKLLYNPRPVMSIVFGVRLFSLWTFLYERCDSQGCPTWARWRNVSLNWISNHSSGVWHCVVVKSTSRYFTKTVVPSSSGSSGSRRILLESLDTEEEDIGIFRNVGNHLPSNTVSHARRLEMSATPQREPCETLSYITWTLTGTRISTLVTSMFVVYWATL